MWKPESVIIILHVTPNMQITELTPFGMFKILLEIVQNFTARNAHSYVSSNTFNSIEFTFTKNPSASDNRYFSSYEVSIN